MTFWKNLSLRWKITLLMCLISLLPIIGITTYSYNQAYWLEVHNSASGLMNFVDAKQQGIIRFLGQNEKLAKQLAVLVNTSDNLATSKYFQAIVETDVFNIEDHPFKDEIKSGQRKIPTTKVYYSIDYVNNGKIIISSDQSRVGTGWTQQVDPNKGYSEVYKVGDVPVITFAAPAGGGFVYVNADARMLSDIVNGEIGNLEGKMGTFYLAGVGKTLDYYIVNRDNVMITESRVYPNAVLNQKGSEFPWQRTIKGGEGKYVTNVGLSTGAREAMGFYQNPDGKLMLGASMPFYDSGWTIVVEQQASEILGPLYTMRNTIIISAIILSILIILLAILFARSLMRPVAVLVSLMGKVENGDLTVKANVTNDEIGQLSGHFNNMITQIKNIIQNVKNASQQVLISSEQLSATSEETTASTYEVSNAIEQLAVGTGKQAEEIEITSQVIKQMSYNIEQMVTNTDEVSKASLKVLDVADNGSKEAENAVTKINRIKDVTTETADVVKTLGQESERIGQIVDVIKGIADQTNLLALNAAIEAARAGEQGRGFAVVADEVRKLAEQSSVSAQQIAELINNIQKETNLAVKIMDVGTKEVADGVIAVNKAGDSFKVIVSEIQRVVEQIRNVTLATQEIAGGSNKVVSSMDYIASYAEETSATSQQVSATSLEQTASMEEIAKAAQELAKMAERLQDTIAAFKY